MKYLNILLILLCTGSIVHAQKSGQTDFELGLSGGTSWYNGDLNPYAHFNDDYMKRAFGVSLRRNLNQRFQLRAQLNYGQVEASDILSQYDYRKNRNLNFSTEIIELSTTIEFNFLYYDALVDNKRFTPYSFIGLSGFYFNPKTEVEGAEYELSVLSTEGKQYSKVNVAIPFGFGLKVAITDRIILSTDWGLRRTFTDYLDDVSSFYPSEDDISGLSEDISDRSLKQAGPDGTNWGTQRGHSLTKDWYTFVMATLSVRIGPKKGSCKHLRI